jgi:hypothetical protein
VSEEISCRKEGAGPFHVMKFKKFESSKLTCSSRLCFMLWDVIYNRVIDIRVIMDNQKRFVMAHVEVYDTGIAFIHYVSKDCS